MGLYEFKSLWTGPFRPGYPRPHTKIKVLKSNHMLNKYVTFTLNVYVAAQT